MNKKKVGVIASAVATCAVCASMIVGSTYALFTSNDKVDISVTAGTVNVSAAIDEKSVQTKELYGEYLSGSDHTFGKDVVVTEKSATLNNMACGDGIKFDIVVSNNSTMDVKYRTILSGANDDGLIGVLNIDMGNGTVYDGSTAYSEWTVMENSSETMTVTIELPEGAGNEYQGKTCSFDFAVEAIQANAATRDGVAHVGEGESRKDHLTLQSAIDGAEAGSTVYVDEDMVIYGQVSINKAMTIEGGDHSITIKNYRNNDSGATSQVNAELGSALYAKAPVNMSNIKFDCYSPKQGGLCLDGAYMYELTNVEVSGEVRHSLVRFFNSSGGVMTDCVVHNSIAPEDTMYYPYGMPVATDIFVNRNTILAGQTQEGGVSLQLNNCEIGSLVANSSSKYFAEPKTYINEGTHIGFVFYDPDEVPASKAIVIDGGEADRVFKPQQYVKNVGLYRDMKLTDTDKDVYAVTNANGLKLLVERVNDGTLKNPEVYLDGDIDLAGENWTPFNFNGKFDGRGHSISNVTVASGNYNAVGFFGTFRGTVENLTINNFTALNVTVAQGAAALAGNAGTGSVINGVTVNNVTISANRRVGGIVGFSYARSVENCVVDTAVLTATPEIVLDAGKLGYDNGDKVGGITGFTATDGSAPNDSYLTANEVKNVTLTAYRDIGGITGYGWGERITDNTVENVTINQNLTYNYKKYDTLESAAERIGDIAGSVATGTSYGITFLPIPEGANKATGVTVNQSEIINRRIIEVSTQEDFVAAFADLQDGDTLILAEGTYTPTDNRQLLVLAKNVTIKGEGADKTVIDCGEWQVDGQAGLFISGDNVTISDLTVKTASTEKNVAAIKVSDNNSTNRAIKNVVIENVVLESVNGHGLNLHGVKGAVVNNVNVKAYGKVGISLALAEDVVITNCTTVSGGWGMDIQIQYSDNGNYEKASSVEIGEGNVFGNGAIRSDRPATATSDVITYNESEWTKTDLSEYGLGFVLTHNN